MGITANIDLFVSPLTHLRRLRRTQAWLLTVVSVGSIVVGAWLAAVRGSEPADVFQQAVGWQFVIWGAIDLIFAGMGVIQSTRADLRPMSAQAEADEFLAAEKLLRSLRFNHKLNVAYLVTAALLLTWAAFGQSPALAGHGVGVLLQGGFLFVFDLVFTAKFSRLMETPV